MSETVVYKVNRIQINAAKNGFVVHTDLRNAEDLWEHETHVADSPAKLKRLVKGLLAEIIEDNKNAN